MFYCADPHINEFTDTVNLKRKVYLTLFLSLSLDYRSSAGANASAGVRIFIGADY
jgi:hypothetical protein